MIAGTGLLDASGQVTPSFPVPADPALAGVTLFGQAVVGTATPRLTNLERFPFDN